jgi:hypothetical protein
MANALPINVRLKFQRLAQERDDARALLDAAQASIVANETACGQMARVRDTAASAADQEEAASKLEELRDEHQRLVQLRHQRDAEHRRAALVCGRCSNWLEQPRQRRLREAPPSKVTHYEASELARVRSRIVDLRSERARIEASPLDRATIEKAVRAQVADLAKSIQIRVSGERGDAAFRIEMTAMAGGWHTPNSLEVLAWMDPEALTARLLTSYSSGDGMTAQDKAENSQRIQRELLQSEREEEDLIEAARVAGVLVQRRDDADPRAILGVVEASSRPTEVAA